MKNNPLFKEILCKHKEVVRKVFLTLLFYFLMSNQLFASSNNVQNEIIKFQSNLISVKELFQEIENQTNYLCVYSSNELDITTKIAIRHKQGKVDDLLKDVIKNTDLKYEIANQYIVISKSKEKKLANLVVYQTANQQKKELVSGCVKDENGNPLIGVSIIVKGKTVGSITDIGGCFKIEAEPNDVLQISYIGYITKLIKAVNSSNDIILKEDNQAIDEVVVVGYGTTKKINLTGSVAAISGSEMVKRPIVNAANMLQGKMPGLSVIQKSGQPGAEDVSFRIRGQGTYSDAGSDPLILINGVPGSLSNLDPAIIENVSVLKDAASASIYGSRAANGVVLITTKDGVSINKKGFTASYSGNYAFYSPTKMLNTIKNSADYMELFNLAKKNSQKAGLYEKEEISKYRTSNGSIEYPNFDWVDFMFNTAFVQNHNISLSGQKEKTSYNLSLNIVDQPGTMKGFDYRKYNFSLTLNSQITKFLKTGTYVSFNYSQQSEPRNGADDAFLCTLAQAPTAGPLLPDDGSGIKRYTFGAYPNIEQSNKNMLAMIDYDIKSKHNTADFNGQFFIELTPFKGLLWHTKIAGRYYDDKLKDWSGTKVPLYGYRTNEMVRNMDLGGGFIPGLQVQDDQTLYTNFYSFIEYNTSFLNDSHHLKGLAGYNQEKNVRDVLWAKRRDYQFNLHELNAGSTEKRENEGYKEEWAIMSGFFRMNYDYKNIYLFEANARLDGTSRIASKNRWGWFPSFSFGYRMTEENYIKNLKWNWLTNLKIRGSRGQHGNQNIGLYPYQEMVDITDSYSFDNSILSEGVAQTDYVNRNMKWETTTITDFGADFTLFDRLNITFDWYSKRTSNILRKAQVSSFIGLNPPTINSGEMVNKGLELSLNWKDIINKGLLKGLEYNLGFYLDHYKNKLVKFGEEEKRDHSILKEGVPYDSYYMLEAIGIFSDQSEINAAPKQFSDQTLPGDIRYRDVDKNGKIDYDDRIVMDGRFPKFEYSFSAGAAWKGFDLSLFLQGMSGKKTYVGSGAGVSPFAAGSIITKDYVEGMWTENEPNNAIHPRLYFGDMGGTRNNRANSYFLKETSYLRLKSLTLGYTFPKMLTSRMAIEKLRLYFSGDNLLTLTPYKGLDPENGNDGTFLTYPQNKIFSFGINVEF